MWQGSQILCVTKKESHAQNKQITAVGYFSVNIEIVKLSWSLIQHDGAAAFTLSERSPLPPSLSAKDIRNNPGFRLKHLGVPDGPDSSDGTSYPLTENYTMPVAPPTGRVA
jgi:hypothetical protein